MGLSHRGRAVAVLLLPLVLVCSIQASQRTCRLSVRVVDEAAQLLPCRAWVDVGDQRLFHPSNPRDCTPYARDRSFSCEGRFALDVPPGKAMIHVERGKEYQPIDRAIDVTDGQDKELTLTLLRWIDMPAQGWYSADLHVHFGANDPNVLRQLALADDVHVTPAFTYWLRGTESHWPDTWPDFAEGEPWRLDETHLVTRTAVEIERIRQDVPPGGSVGATFLFNLTQPISTQRYGEYFPTDADLCLAARHHSPDCVIDTDKPSWAETVVGVAPGTYDTIQVCHNHYHREQTIPGGWGMIGPLAPGESNAAEGDGLFHRTNGLYYRFLNCGFKLGVSGGSAIGVMPVPMGYSRVYARIEGPLNTTAYWAAVKAGRSFATSGPMLTMTADGQGLGATLERQSNANKTISVQVRVRSIDQLEALQLVQEGLVIESLDLTVDRYSKPIPVPVAYTKTLRRLRQIDAEQHAQRLR